MPNFLKNIFSSSVKAPKEIAVINRLEEETKALTDEQIKAESLNIRERVKSGELLDDILPRAYALVRDASRRTLGQRHFDVQLWGGIMLNRGAITEMMTGEGKTLTATTAAYLNALSGEGAHVITVNDYLAKRDAVWMGQIYYFLGLSTACILHDSAFIYDPAWKLTKEEQEKIDKDRDTRGSFIVHQEFLRPISRREAYQADITYGTNHEFGFDYLRDNLAQSIESRVQRGLNFAIIDEVDSILIDEARTPLIISVPDKESSENYKVFARAVKNLIKDEDYIVDEKLKSCEITDSGINKIERMVGVKDLYATENLRLVHFLEACLKAQAIFQKDRDYVSRNGEIVIVDQFTGRLMMGRRYSAGLHQAIEAKEGVIVKEETRTYAQITIQNYFRLYKKISGMTGTAQTSAEEFHKVYNLEVHTIPTNRALVRKDMPDKVFDTTESKYRGIVRDIKERQQKGQPVLVGTISIEKNEFLGKILKDNGIRFEILNAKNHEREGAIIAQAGRVGAVTVATNLAGRGVDIILGGNPANPEEAKKVRELGGLHIIGTERHEARRIDNQLRGRAGRQGDPGSSQFFLSLEDDLMRIFGGDRIKNMMSRFKMDDELPSSGLINRSIAQSQSRVEGFNFDARKHLLDYDDILNKQRINFYERRLNILKGLASGGDESLREIIKNTLNSYVDRLMSSELPVDELVKLLEAGDIITKAEGEKFEGRDEVFEFVKKRIEERMTVYKPIQLAGKQMLGTLDFLWMNNLEDIDAITESVRLRAYGQRDPLVEYRKESHKLFEDLKANFEAWVFGNIFKIEATEGGAATHTHAPKVAAPTSVEFKDVGRNDLCPCGSGKKYKKCHGAA